MAPDSKGVDHYFKDQHFHYETLRVVAHAPYGGADIGEVFAVVRNIQEGNLEDWYREWYRMAVRVEEKARAYQDPIGKGRGLMRAQNYYRNSEFYLDPEDERREDTFKRSAENFREALQLLNVEYDEFDVPYESNELKAIYYPSNNPQAGNKPLILAHGGYDSTLEELYFWIVAPALERGYSVLTFSGPGQGSMLRKQGLTFTPEWEKPTGAVIDEFLRHYSKPPQIVLMGLSMGGMLAPRAAAYEERIDGVIAFDAMYDFQGTLFYGIPKFQRGIVRWLYENEFNSVLGMLLAQRARSDVGTRWGLQNGQWTLGFENLEEVFDAFAPYHLRDAASEIRSDVLLLWGEDDHFMDPRQLTDMQSGLVNARSVTTQIYNKEEGGHEHCQTGILSSVHADMFSWIAEKFPSTHTTVPAPAPLD
ncbi:MAG: alpha/beta fold hydrolase [Pseudohongiellaceae bacterium]